MEVLGRVLDASPGTGEDGRGPRWLPNTPEDVAGTYMLLGFGCLPCPAGRGRARAVAGAWFRAFLGDILNPLAEPPRFPKPFGGGGVRCLSLGSLVYLLNLEVPAVPREMRPDCGILQTKLGAPYLH